MHLARRRLPLMVVWATLVCSCAAIAQSPSDDARLIAATRQFVPEVMLAYGVPGVELAIAHRSGIVLEEGFGYADMGRQTPMTAQTVFAAGSMSKPYTATAVMQLVEKGVLALDTPINTYLQTNAGFTVVNPLGAREITVRDLLIHRSGLTSDAAGSELTPPAPLKEYLRAQYSSKGEYSYSGSSLPLWSAKVGEKYQYSNTGIATLGLLVEITNPEHLSYDRYVERHIFEPLEMRSSQFPALQDTTHLRPDLARRFARGYSKLGPIDLPSPQIYLGDYPAGTLVSVPGDHIRLLLAYMSGGTYRGQRILQPESVQLMLSEATPGQGLVWRLWDAGKPEFGFGHGGAYMFGWRNEFRAYPNLDVAVVVATNQWDMLSAVYGSGYDAVLSFIVSWVKHEKEGLRHPQVDATWAWKCSYVMGLVWVDQIMGALGTHSPLTARQVDAAVQGASERSAGLNGGHIWSGAGFRAGVEDMMHVPMQIDSIQAFISSDRLRVWPEELNLIYAALGGPKNWIPMPEFAPSGRH